VSGMHAGFGGTLDHQIDRPHHLQILRRADIAVMKHNATRSQPRQCQFAAASLEIVERDDRRFRIVAFDRKREGTADKPGAAGDQNFSVFDGALLHEDDVLPSSFMMLVQIIEAGWPDSPLSWIIFIQFMARVLPLPASREVRVTWGN